MLLQYPSEANKRYDPWHTPPGGQVLQTKAGSIRNFGAMHGRHA